jgi:hypothetical protein
MDILDRAAVAVSHNLQCSSFDYTGLGEPLHGYNQTSEFMCYPIRQYTAYLESEWDNWGLREPAYFGAPATGLAEVGELIAADSRFHSCTAQHFFAYFAQIDEREVPADVTDALQEAFVSSGFDAKHLAKQALLRPELTAFASDDEQEGNPVVSVKTVRAETYATAIEDLTGYRWLATGDGSNCATINSFNGNQCWAAVDLNKSDVFGFRSMVGGVDGLTVTRPARTVTPIKMVAAQMYATDAAKYVVDADFAMADPAQRRLMPLVESDTTDEAMVRAQLVWLHARILGEYLPEDDLEIDATLALWNQALGVQGGDVSSAWVITLSALFQDTRFLFY